MQEPQMSSSLVVSLLQTSTVCRPSGLGASPTSFSEIIK